ncbi:MAG: hypothetical protein E7046_06950 [Lentisphaerae bacterium]|nr:hypothetical protein [Lentisphaerota bacterium]
MGRIAPSILQKGRWMLFLLGGKTFMDMIFDVSYDVNSSRLYFGIIAQNKPQIYNVALSLFEKIWRIAA